MLVGDFSDIIFLFLVSNIGFYTFSKFYTGPQFDETGFRYKKDYLRNLYIPILKDTDITILRKQLNLNITTIEDAKKLDNFSEKIFFNTIGLDDDEIAIIKGYKMSLLQQKKTNSVCSR
jgi:hypothetical protein